MNIKKISGSIVIALVFAVVLAACSDGSSDSGGGTVGLLGAPSVNGIQTYYEAGLRPVTSQSDAEDLFEALTNNLWRFIDILEDADDQAFDKAFKAANGGMSLDFAYLMTKAQEKGINMSLNINDDLALLEVAKNNGQVTPLVRAKITGTEKATFSLNPQTLYQYQLQDGLAAVNDSLSYSLSSDRKFDINTGFIEFSSGYYNPTTYKVAGIIQTEFKMSGKNTLKDKNNATYDKFVGSDNGQHRVAVALTVSDGTRGAKFRFSFADKWNSEWRSTIDSGSSNYSDIEVYDDLNNLRFTIQSNNVSTWEWRNLASAFSKGMIFAYSF